MSTTFDVYPSQANIPTFSEVLDLSNVYLRKFLAKHGIHRSFQIDVDIKKYIDSDKADISVPFVKSEAAKWNADEYAWFFVEGRLGGSDAYFCKFEDRDWLDDDEKTVEAFVEGRFLEREKTRIYERELRNCFNNGFYWWFRRSAGQPAIINLSYGMIAAAFAKLTDGIIESIDCAWNGLLFPVQADEFVLHYFDPDCPNLECGDWAKCCLDDIQTTNYYYKENETC